MYQSQSLEELCTEVQRQHETKQDLVATTAVMEYKADENARRVFLNTKNEAGETESRPFVLTDHAESQLFNRIKLPITYARNLTAAGYFDLLSHNANELMHRAPQQRMLRTLDNQCRAVLSTKYRRLDNYDLLRVFLSIMAEGDYKGLDVQACNSDRDGFYLKAVFPKFEGEVARGDVVQAGVAISNNEVGLGSVLVQPLIYRLVCSNGMVLNDANGEGIRRRHVGREHKDDGVILTDQTRALQDQAFWHSVKDTIRHVLDEKVFAGNLERIKAKGAEPIAEPKAAVELLATEAGFTDREADRLLTQFVSGIAHEGLSADRWGLANAVTAMGNGSLTLESDCPVSALDADRFERLGGRLIQDDTLFAKLAKAKANN